MKIHGIVRKRITTDGPGITDLISMTGCPLSCKYCLNKRIIESAPVYEVSTQKLYELILPDICYFYATEGGVTFGGGEPLLQADEIVQFAESIPEWISINIETSLNAEKSHIQNLIPYVNEWIVDIKSLKEEIYHSYTLKHSKHENLNLLPKEKCRIRIPVIPNYKTKEIANQEKEELIKMGFQNIEIFNYITGREK